MQIYNFKVNEDGREIIHRGTPQFPIEMYCNEFAKIASNDIPWHWHDEVEFSFPLEGRMEARYDGGTSLLSTGDGIFVNSNSLHSLHPVGSTPCVMANIIFDTQILSGAPLSVFEQKYILPLTRSKGVKCVPLTGHTKIMNLLNNAFMTYTEQKFGYEWQVRNLLADLWLLLFSLLQDKIGHPGIRQNDTRIKKMLTYIHDHFADDISLEDVAASANISPRECSRAFQEHLGMSTFSYITKYRIRVAAELLARTDMPVIDISFSVGYNAPSYFGKLFREATGSTPREYRKKVLATTT
ncbi:AraC family transcriptional regulator [Christensenellaceae bacterium OttesenSCG-928-K19]|nr:AraC family transcriptional regulator [Christensenellaceae bacterium OttesenSCG-928-K19]